MNNEVFPSSLNIDLTNMFLDLKDGAKIVSLKPFVHEGFRMNDSNVRMSAKRLTEFYCENDLTFGYSATRLTQLSSSKVIIMPKAGSAGKAIRASTTSRRSTVLRGSSGSSEPWEGGLVADRV